MSDINAAPSSTEPAVSGDNVNATEVQAQAQEAGGATAGESAQSAATAESATADTDAFATSQANSSALGADAPAVATSGEATPGASAATVTSESSAVASVDAGIAAADTGNAGASPAAGQSASDTASSAPPASQGDDTAADALRSEIASLEQQLTDAHAEVAKWQGLYNAATADAAGHPIHSILASIEAEIDRPAAILKSHVKSLLNDARALFRR